MDTNINKRSRRRKVTAFSLAALLMIAGVAAYLTDSISFTNMFSMATDAQAVDITAQEQMVNGEGSTVAYADPTNVKAGDLVSKIPQVAQKGAENEAVWVRAEVVLTTPEAEAAKTQLTAASVNGVSADWTLNNAETITDEANHSVTLYYYKNTGLDIGATAMSPLFTGVQIPSDWGNESAGTVPSVIVTFQAIQKEHVIQGSLTEANPWGDATPAAFETVE